MRGDIPTLYILKEEKDHDMSLMDQSVIKEQHDLSECCHTTEKLHEFFQKLGFRKKSSFWPDMQKKFEDKKIDEKLESEILKKESLSDKGDVEAAAAAVEAAKDEAEEKELAKAAAAQEAAGKKVAEQKAAEEEKAGAGISTAEYF